MAARRENSLLAAIVAASLSAAALVAGAGFGDRDDRVADFQSLVRGLGLGCQCDLGHGAAPFDPRLLGGEPPPLDRPALGKANCTWHPIAIFPAPTDEQLASPGGE